MYFLALEPTKERQTPVYLNPYQVVKVEITGSGLYRDDSWMYVRITDSNNDYYIWYAGNLTSCLREAKELVVLIEKALSE